MIAEQLSAARPRHPLARNRVYKAVGAAVDRTIGLGPVGHWPRALGNRMSRGLGGSGQDVSTGGFGNLVYTDTAAAVLSVFASKEVGSADARSNSLS